MLSAAVLRRASAVQTSLQAPRHQRRQWVATPLAAAAKQKQKRQQLQQQGGKGFGRPSMTAELKPNQQQSAAPSGSVAAPQLVVEPGAAAAADASVGEVPGSTTSDSGSFVMAELPAVSKGHVFAVCAQVSLLVSVLGFGLRQVAPAISPAIGDGQVETVEALLNWAALPSAGQLALSAAIAVAVTGARVVLLAAWPDFREASERSNQQVLSPLGAADLVWVGVLPAISEELLFRGALIPAVYPDWRGVLIAGLAFGMLHNSGGRNLAFAAWASVVGCAYGALFLATGSLACPALAHSLANIASAALWKAGLASSSGGGAGST